MQEQVQNISTLINWFFLKKAKGWEGGIFVLFTSLILLLLLLL